MTVPSPMNLVYLHSHDTGRHVQPYGYGVSTPNMQRLAGDGVLFRQAFNAAPTCSPSRAALLTGQSPHSAGMIGLAHRGFGLKNPSQHIAHTLHHHGYTTTLAGVQHVTTDDPKTLGYDMVISPEDKSVASVGPVAAQHIQELGAQQGGKPFFVDVGFFEAHRPFPPAGLPESRYVRPPAPIPDTPETRLDTASFYSSVREFDRGVGIVLDALESAGLTGSTLVICTTDHGAPFPAMKSNLTDHGTGVLLIMRGPGRFIGGGVVDALVSHIDLFPTICELTGIPQPSWLQGKSMMPLINGEQTEIREAVFGEVTFHAAYEPQRSVRTQRWTYIRRFGDRETPVLPNIDGGESRDFWLQHGWEHRRIEPEQLYDNLLDPTQSRNLIADPEFSAVRDELTERLAQWMSQTDDPLLEGEVRLPPGALINDASSRSADEELLQADADGNLTRTPNLGINA
ncbi:sulfatase [soil metagenome]